MRQIQSSNDELITVARNAEISILAAMRKAERCPSQGVIAKAFNELVRVVEVKKAKREESFALEYDHFYPGRRCGFLGLQRRSPAAGLAYLKWEASLNETMTEGEASREISAMEPAQRAEAARDALSLYVWWTEQRPTRPSPLRASGLETILEKLRPNRGSSPQGTQCVHGGDELSNGSAEAQSCSACLLAVGLAQARAEELLAQYELEDTSAFSRLTRIPLRFFET